MLRKSHPDNKKVGRRDIVTMIIMRIKKAERKDKDN